MAGINSLLPELRPYANELLRIAGSARLNPRITSARRTRAQQAKLYRSYLAGASHYPVAPPGTSSHEYGWAFDLVTSPMESLAELGEIWESWGGVWGGRFNDEVHFEGPGWPHKAAAAVPQGNIIARAAEGAVGLYEELPWYLQLLVPSQLTPSKREYKTEDVLRDWYNEIFGEEKGLSDLVTGR